MRRPGVSAFAAIAAIILLASSAAAQTPAPAVAAPKPKPTFEVNWGYTVFSVSDDETGESESFEHTALGGGGRIPITSRLAIGGEILHLRGPGADRDWIFAGKLTFDLIPDTVDVPKPAVPYVVGSGGYMKHTDERNEVPITVKTGVGNGGIGVRIALGRMLYVAPEFRFGFEQHWNIGIVIGVRAR